MTSKRSSGLTRRKWGQVARTYMNRPFPQTHTISSSQFESCLRDRGINVGTGYLEGLEERRLLLPLYRQRVDHAKNWHEFFPADEPEFAELREEQKKPSKRNGPSITAYYHPYQVYIIDELNGLTIPLSFMYLEKDSQSILKDVDGIRKSHASQLNVIMKSWKETQLLNLFRFLLIIEQKYLPEVTRSIKLHHFLWRRKRIMNVEDWYRWSAGLRGQDTMERLHLTVEQLKSWHTHFSIKATNIDPLKKWYPLVRHIPWSKRKELTGKALLAQYYYQIAEMIRYFLRDAAGEDLPSEIRWGYSSRPDQYEIERYGKSINYRERDTLRFILNEYELNPQEKVRVFVEGDSEETALKIIAEFQGIDLEYAGIVIENVGGEGNIREEKLKGRLHDLQKKHVRYFFLLDPHNNAKMALKKLEGVTLRQRGLSWLFRKEWKTIWEKDFERDNFSLRELGRGLTEQARKHGYAVKFTARDLESYKILGDVYKRKLQTEHDSLNKPDLIRSLIEERLHRIARRKRPVTKEIPIIVFYRRVLGAARTNFLPIDLRHQEDLRKSGRYG